MTLPNTRRASAVIFAVLVGATVAAFFVTQRVKQAPAVVQSVKATRTFSPRGELARRATISFRLKRSDDVSVAIVDSGGEVVRRLVDGRPLRAYRRLTATWDGRDDDLRLAPDGRYRPLIGLRAQGRSVTVQRSIVLDSTPPRPVVTHVSPGISPTGGSSAISARFEGPRHATPTFLVYRTRVERGARLVARFDGRVGSGLGEWDGRLPNGRRAPAGTYLIAVRTRDKAGNVGSAPAQLPPRRGLSGRSRGVTVRYLGIEPPLSPALAGGPVSFAVDARQRRYRWSVRRLGARRPIKRGVKTTFRLRLRAPRGASGVYLLEAHTRERSTRVPFTVQARPSSKVLVVLPALTWQGRNEVDDDGDGFADTLDAAPLVRIARPFTGGRLPVSLAARVAPLLIWLDRERLRYDLTTDYALATGAGPSLQGHEGVLLAGDFRWLPDSLGRSLRRYVQRGGRVASLGVESLRRGVRLGRKTLRRPTAAAALDVFGARLRPPAAFAENAAPNLLVSADELGLFSATGGQFSGFHQLEQLVSIAPPGRLVAAAGIRADQPTITAHRLGKGIVVRFGLPEWSRRLSDETAPEVAATMRRTWTVLSR